ncbi:hypothetical protein CYFUS_009761 [Cystobacter fuscus]|uniref:Tox-REase-5 domain-containing protein n=1 Tax=Cystobacter fuscus TaxID=43 RepID=A0A250JK69_9BACT|nr:restriction endonuclease fold toxin 5 domain-containing protein [Cystobacter fuscus]ATB44274.1 hypothetical protein CYFUS_009761 [Cystobacter fuscus]
MSKEPMSSEVAGSVGARGLAGMALCLLAFVVQTACVTNTSLDASPVETRRHQRATHPNNPATKELAESEARSTHSRPWSQPSSARDVDEAEHREGSAIGWPDGVGDGRPLTVPITLDYFQGFLVQAGVPTTAVPTDGRTLSPRQALELVPHLLSTPVTLGNFGSRRMAAHLLLEVATGRAPVSRDELHARMRRFSRLLVLRPDGYLVKATSGVAVQKAGQVVLANDGTLRAGRFEVGPFYAIDGGRLFPVDVKLEVPHGAPPAGSYEPDDNAGFAVAEGAVLAVVDMVEGLYRLVFHTGETLEGLSQLPSAVRQLYENSPRLWEEFRHKPYAERVRTVSRLATGIVLTVGTSGAGASKAASWGGKLGGMSVPLLSMSGDGLLAVRLVAVPARGAVAVAGNALSATYVLHMANTGARGAGAGGGWPPVGGPGQWVEDTSSMSEQARDYQAQVTGAPKRWAYRVCRDGECVNYDGYDPQTGTLLEAKAREYDKWFDENLDPRFEYRGLDSMIDQARRQLRVAGEFPLRWHVAEPRMVDVLRKHFAPQGFHRIEIVYTKPGAVRTATHE